MRKTKEYQVYRDSMQGAYRILFFARRRLAEELLQAEVCGLGNKADDGLGDCTGLIQ
jgi:hypothetical protein